ncbi:murein biosynthesis integral membrane protein MurJ [Salipaludibacillus neizhouensis]|uniref:Probable lipid II flippase MurJ n=1 Tax=Salipaludibacillus neizhouensis TaxID=885475 RepID=A0A3A9K749_9BACI|nr:murein biosynthesis integral membrane protein MurJ [Salipaludibacillus neizhouensis]RKL68059.1 murein biosynthesis integral membrane protein MurJ [Salipaludibacillus neizhouensis]
MKKTALILIVVTIFSKIFGFAREIILSYFYGASNISDAYLIATTIPKVIFAFIATGIATSYIPMYTNIIKNNDIPRADRFTGNLINFLLILSTLIVVLAIMFPSEIVKLFASGFEGSTFDLAVYFTRISVFEIYFASMIAIFSSYLQLKNNFIAPALMGLPLNFIIIISITLSAHYSISILPYGTVIGSACQLLFLLPFVYKKGYRHQIILDRNDIYLKKMIYLALPVIIGVSVNQINVLIDRTLASQIAIGGISALTYANRLNLFVQGIFVTSIATVMYPLISKMAVDMNISGLKKTLSESIVSINILLLPTIVAIMVFAEEVVELLFGRGAFDLQAIQMTSNALFFYSIGMIGFGLREVLSRVFYSLQDTKTPMINAAVGMVLNIVLNIILSKYLGIGGLALATSISAIFTAGLITISLRKKIGSLGIKQISFSFIKIIFSSLVMGILVSLSFNYLITILSQNIALLISIAIGVFIYIVVIYFMKIEEVNEIINAVKRKIGKKI